MNILYVRSGSEKWVHDRNLPPMDAAHKEELVFINKSLSALSLCVKALKTKKGAHIPFRNSTLTRILQSSLDGKGYTGFIVTCSPLAQYVDETISTMRFADSLKCITIAPKVKNSMSESTFTPHREYYEQKLHRMRQEVNELKQQLQHAEMRERRKVAATKESVKLREENLRLRTLLKSSEKKLAEERFVLFFTF